MDFVSGQLAITIKEIHNKVVILNWRLARESKDSIHLLVFLFLDLKMGRLENASSGNRKWKLP